MDIFSRLFLLMASLVMVAAAPPVQSADVSPGPPAFAGKTIVIDPGHGGKANSGTDAARTRSSANNATSATLGILEKDVTLELAKLTAARIAESPEAKAGKVRAVLTRDTDTNPDFAQRVTTAAGAGACCFVGIHFNADASQKVSGPRAIIRQASQNPHFEADKAFGLALARAIRTVSVTFRPATPAATFHDDHELHKGAGSHLFYQLQINPKTRGIPACHLEVEFLDNRELEKSFFRDRRKELFEAWAQALADELIRQALT
jgi:hypothetical protein